jgi:hypothetical protein
MFFTSSLILFQSNNYAEDNEFWLHAVLIHVITSFIK